jgi:hypothetical protein
MHASTIDHDNRYASLFGDSFVVEAWYNNQPNTRRWHTSAVQKLHSPKKWWQVCANSVQHLSER